MIEERKKHVRPWVAALVVTLPALYVASFGPAFWLFKHTEITNPFAWHFYRPIAWIYQHGTQPIRVAIEWYCLIVP